VGRLNTNAGYASKTNKKKYEKKKQKREWQDKPLVLEKLRSNKDQREVMVCLEFAVLLGVIKSSRATTIWRPNSHFLRVTYLHQKRDKEPQTQTE
jgi:hypothetical protein